MQKTSKKVAERLSDITGRKMRVLPVEKGELNHFIGQYIPSGPERILISPLYWEYNCSIDSDYQDYFADCHETSDDLAELLKMSPEQMYRHTVEETLAHEYAHCLFFHRYFHRLKAAKKRIISLNEAFACWMNDVYEEREHFPSHARLRPDCRQVLFDYIQIKKFQAEHGIEHLLQHYVSIANKFVKKDVKQKSALRKSVIRDLEKLFKSRKQVNRIK